MFEDITAKHDAEETAAANLASLERLNQLKSEFVSMVSHEFRTALVGIQGFSEILATEGNSPEDVKSLAGDIFSDAQRLNRMINEMLDLDRMEAGKIRIQSKPVDLNGLVRDVVDRARASSDRHTIRTDLDDALPIISDEDCARSHQGAAGATGPPHVRGAHVGAVRTRGARPGRRGVERR